MTDRPILFSAPMVRALLDGRKTQTRRVLKPSRGAQADWLTMDVLHQAPSCYLAEVDGRLGVQMQHPRAGQCIDGIDIDPMSPLTWVRLPYAPGDRLWVREAWAKVGDEQDDIHACPDMRIPAYYRADMVDPERQRWRPSIHMPRWASRLTLTVTDVRVQRLQDITLGDICAEGLARSIYDFRPVQRGFDAWQALWDSLNAARAPWAANPWVCALTFTVQRGKIDGVA